MVWQLLKAQCLSLKNVNAIAHFTDWIIAHVHVGALAWNGFLAFGMIYWLVPRLFKTKLHSIGLANLHFWIGTLGIIMYALPMYVAGFTQASMWKQFNPDGTLVYGNFLETVIRNYSNVLDACDWRYFIPYWSSYFSV